MIPTMAKRRTLLNRCVPVNDHVLISDAVTATARAAQACDLTPYVGPGFALGPWGPSLSIKAWRMFPSFAFDVPHKCSFTSFRETKKSCMGVRGDPNAGIIFPFHP